MTDAKVFTVEIEVHEGPTETEAKALLGIAGEIRVAGVGPAATLPIRTVRPSARSWRSHGR